MRDPEMTMGIFATRPLLLTTAMVLCVAANTQHTLAQATLQIPSLDSVAACRRADSPTECLSKERSAELSMRVHWVAAPEDRRAACIIYLLIGPPHGYADLEDCLAGMADLSAMMSYLRTAQERQYKFRYFYAPPNVAIPVETLGDCVAMERRWKTGLCANGPQ